MNLTSSSNTYLITNKDTPIDIKGPNGGAESASLSLSKALAKEGKKVYFASNMNFPECEIDGINYISFGEDYNITKTLYRISSLGPYHLIAQSKAHSILESRYDKNCLSRIFITHDQKGIDAGIGLKVVSKVADYIVCVSNAHKKELIKAKASESKIKVIHNGVDLDIFKPREIKDRDPYKLVFAGALVYDKGVHLLIESFIKLKETFPNLTLDIYGSASLWDREEFLEKKKIENSVTGIKFFGKVKKEKVAEAFMKGTIVVVPSIWFETFSLVAAEASVTGAPVVCFNIGGIKEVIKQNITGFLIDQISSNALTLTLENLLKNKDKLELFSKNAIKERKYYNWKRVSKEIINLSIKASNKKNSLLLLS